MLQNITVLDATAPDGTGSWAQLQSLSYELFLKKSMASYILLIQQGT